MFSEKLAKNVKKKLIDNNMTQKQLAESVGSTLAYVNMILNCKCENLELESKILKVLDMNDTRSRTV